MPARCNLSQLTALVEDDSHADQGRTMADIAEVTRGPDRVLPDQRTCNDKPATWLVTAESVWGKKNYYCGSQCQFVMWKDNAIL